MPPIARKIGDKVAYVKRQGQTRDHHCHWPSCGAQVPPAMWGCKPHWFRLPKHLRDAIWAAYRPGQEIDMSPSRQYLQVANQVQGWIKSHFKCIACSGSGVSSKGEGCVPCSGTGVKK